MEDICGMQCLQSAEGLVNEILTDGKKLDIVHTIQCVTYLAMIIAEALSSNHSMQIGLHELLNDCIER